jgi:hypothetical protein
VRRAQLHGADQRVVEQLRGLLPVLGRAVHQRAAIGPRLRQRALSCLRNVLRYPRLRVDVRLGCRGGRLVGTPEQGRLLGRGCPVRRDRLRSLPLHRARRDRRLVGATQQGWLLGRGGRASRDRLRDLRVARAGRHRRLIGAPDQRRLLGGRGRASRDRLCHVGLRLRRHHGQGRVLRVVDAWRVVQRDVARVERGRRRCPGAGVSRRRRR